MAEITYFRAAFPGIVPALPERADGSKLRA